MAKSGQVNVAIVGLGFGAEFIPIYQAHPGANIHAICRRNEQKLNEIGDALGFDSVYSFSRFFKRINGKSPTDFKQLAASSGGDASQKSPGFR